MCSTSCGRRADRAWGASSIGSAPPPFDPLVATPTTWPGARLPHLFLADGTALYDHLGREFTLLTVGDTNCGGFADAAERAGVPLKIVSLCAEPRLAILERKLVLVRPDQHVAWRGNEPPADSRFVLDRVTGHDIATAIDAAS